MKKITDSNTGLVRGDSETTPGMFTTWAEAVYGKYTPAMKQEVEKCLKGKSGFWLDTLREITLQEHPSQYGKPPGVHEIYAMRLLVRPPDQRDSRSPQGSF